jgi:glycosyltransferase involved in cell wall biosynthesis
VQFSVVITNYNHHAYLADAIDSALSQENCAQVVVVNDGNTFRPNTPHNDSRLAFVDIPHSGQLAAINRGFAQTTGDIVTLLDADDVYPAGYFEVLNHAYARTLSLNTLYVRPWCFRTTNEIDNERVHFADCELTHMGPLRFLSTSRPYWWLGVPTSGISLRREFGKKVFPVPYENEWFIGADQPICHRINLLQDISYYLEGITIHYRLHDNNQFTTSTGNNPIEQREEKYDKQLQDMRSNYPNLFSFTELLKSLFNRHGNKYRWYKQLKGYLYMWKL